MKAAQRGPENLALKGRQMSFRQKRRNGQHRGQQRKKQGGPRRVTLGGGARDQHTDFSFSEKAQRQSGHRECVLSPPRAATPAVGSIHRALRADSVLEPGFQAQQVKALGGTQGSWYIT